MQMRRELLHRCPGVPIVGQVYPPGDGKILIANIAQYIFFAGLGLVFLGEMLFKLMGMAEPPPWYAAVQQNKLQVCMFLWIGNSFAAGQLSTGAFEVSYDGKPVFSRLEEGRFPEMGELIHLLVQKGVACQANGRNGQI